MSGQNYRSNWCNLLLLHCNLLLLHWYGNLKRPRQRQRSRLRALPLLLQKLLQSQLATSPTTDSTAAKFCRTFSVPETSAGLLSRCGDAALWRCGFISSGNFGIPDVRQLKLKTFLNYLRLQLLHSNATRWGSFGIENCCCSGCWSRWCCSLSRVDGSFQISRKTKEFWLLSFASGFTWIWS